MQGNLESQNKNLAHILKEIEDKKKLAERYRTLAQTDQREFAAFRGNRSRDAPKKTFVAEVLDWREAG